MNEQMSVHSGVATEVICQRILVKNKQKSETTISFNFVESDIIG